MPDPAALSAYLDRLGLSSRDKAAAERAGEAVATALADAIDREGDLDDPPAVSRAALSVVLIAAANN